jgi:hypothetical protein
MAREVGLGEWWIIEWRKSIPFQCAQKSTDQCVAVLSILLEAGLPVQSILAKQMDRKEPDGYYRSCDQTEQVRWKSVSVLPQKLINIVASRGTQALRSIRPGLDWRGRPRFRQRIVLGRIEGAMTAIAKASVPGFSFAHMNSSGDPPTA